MNPHTLSALPIPSEDQNMIPILPVIIHQETKVTGQKFAQTMVMITHNEEIAQMADRIVRIEDGRIVTR